MKIVVLAAGYATRLYPLTLDRPKGLLPIAGKPMVEHVFERLAGTRGLDGAYLVTNAKFAAQFSEWATAYEGLRPDVVDDGTIDDAGRLGAIGDLGFVIEQCRIDDDVIAVAGDNLFSADLSDFGAFGSERSAPVIAVYDVGDLDVIRGYSSIEMDANNRIVSLEEKPAEPRTTLAGIALYFYPRESLPLVRRYLDDGNNPDQPGRLVEWLYPRTAVYGWRVPGLWFDIGSKETLEEADRMFTDRVGRQE